MRQEIHTKRRTFRRRKPPLWMRASILLLIVVVVGVPLFSLFAPAGTVQAAWYNSSWTYRIKLTVNAEHVAQDTATTTVFLASGSSWTVPQGWSSSNNTIECIGAGGDGGNGSGSATGSGGGGGAYAKISNLSLTPGASVAYVVGTGGSQNDTYFNGVASTSASLSCAPGKNGTTGNTVAGGVGGLTTNSTGTTEFNGGSGSVSAANRGGGAGGGSAGPTGAGKNGGKGNGTASVGGGGGGSNGGSSTAGSDGVSGPTGGAGGAGTSGTGGGAGAVTSGSGSAGTVGGGGGGGIGHDASGTAISIGGLYGGGGGAKGDDAIGSSAGGAQGIIVIRYTPVISSAPSNAVFSTAPYNASSTAITMVATSTDAGGGTEIEVGTYLEFYYDYFACGGSNDGTGGTDSGWVIASTYTDSGLQANQCYSYKVTARDGLSNISATSTASTTYTSAIVPGTPIITSQTSNTLTISNDANGNPSSNPTTQFALQIISSSPTDSVWDSKYIDSGGNPSATAVWLSDAAWDAITVLGVHPGTQYQIRAKARNEDGDETAFSNNGSVQTTADSGARIRGGVRLKGGVRLH